MPAGDPCCTKLDKLTFGLSNFPRDEYGMGIQVRLNTGFGGGIYILSWAW